MTKFLNAFLALLSLLVLSACQEVVSSYDIVATSFPTYDIASNINGDILTIDMLLAPGSELHDYQPTSTDMKKINQASMFIYTSDQLEPWAKNINHSNKINLSELSVEIKLLHDQVHYWTNPLVYIDLIEKLAIDIISLDMENTNTYIENKTNYIKKIRNHHEQFQNYLDDYDTEELKPIFLFGHNGMKNFEILYNLTITPLSLSLTPTGEYNPRQVENLINQMKDYEAHTIFVEELFDTNKVSSLHEEFKNNDIDLNIHILHSYHNVSLRDFNEGVTYEQLLYQNISLIKNVIFD